MEAATVALLAANAMILLRNKVVNTAGQRGQCRQYVSGFCRSNITCEVKNVQKNTRLFTANASADHSERRSLGSCGASADHSERSALLIGPPQNSQEDTDAWVSGWIAKPGVLPYAPSTAKLNNTKGHNKLLTVTAEKEFDRKRY